jgi:thiol:disulfide interchange protein DsbD
VKRGGVVTEALNVTILPGFHVNSDKPRDEFLIPLKLTWSEGPLQVRSVIYPQPEELQVGPEKLVVLTGRFQIHTEFKAQENAPAGAATVTGKLRYQACNNQMCFRPASVDVSLPIVVQ